MSGYQRQSAADIVPTAVVRAAPINNELNALRDAFAVASGHRHDGSSTEGSYVPLIADADALNKVAVDTTNNRIGVFVEVGGAAVEQVRVQDGAVVPVTTNDIDLGTNSLKFKSAFLSGTAAVDVLTAATSASIPSLTVGTSAVIASADINAGTVDGTVIGASSAQAITGTTITATTGFVGGLTGAVTGNTAGTHTGPVIGAVTGDVTGNITASTGTSSFNDVTINGGLNMNAGTAATITNLTSPTNAGDAATKGYVDTSISNLIDSSPGTLDTLNELAAALGDDPNFATTVTNSIATKLPLAGGTMSGAIAMGTNKITGLGNPTANQDAATKTYVDTADALKLSLSGGTMSGAIAMGTSKITGLGTPTDDADATTKLYVDGILGSATAAATSAAAAATSASNAATSASNASTSASNASTSASAASTSATAAAASYDAFDDRYLGSKTSAPSVDNDGNALLAGALYWNSTSSELYLWTGSAWTRSALTGADYVAKAGDTMTGSLVVSVTDNTNAALRITQLGTGNALLVEDATNPDSTPFVIDATGNAIIGSTTAQSLLNPVNQLQATNVFQVNGTTYPSSSASVLRSADVAQGPYLLLAKSRGSLSAKTTVNSGDTAGTVSFQGYDGTNFVQPASISAAVDGTPGTGDMPGRLVFSTTADGASIPTERMRINSAGGIGMGGQAIAGETLRIGKAITGATSANNVYNVGEVQSDVTTSAIYYRTVGQTQAASFTLEELKHFEAVQGTFGAGSAVTNQYGFMANGTLVGATNNFGFYGAIPAGTGDWNFYAAGSANNYFAGNVGIGAGKTVPATALDITGKITTTGGIVTRVNAQTTTTSPWAWNSDSYDQQEFTALANALTINADAGTPTDGQKTIFRFQDNGTARALTWTTGTSKSFRAIGVSLPTTTVISKTMYVGCIYNSGDARWDVIAVAQEA